MKEPISVALPSHVKITDATRRDLLKQKLLREAGLFATQTLEVFEWAENGALWIRCPVRGYGFTKLERGEWQAA